MFPLSQYIYWGDLCGGDCCETLWRCM